MTVSSTYFLEKAFGYLLGKVWIWYAIILLVLCSFFIDSLPLSFPVQFALATAVWSIWCVGIAGAALPDNQSKPWTHFAQGLLYALKAVWYPILSGILAGLLAYCAFDMPQSMSVEQSFLMLMVVGALEIILWSLGLLIQPLIATGHTSYRAHSAFFASLSRRTIESMLKLLVVVGIAVLLGTAIILQLIWSIEYIGAVIAAAWKSSWVAPLWAVSILQRTLAVIWYALYTLCGVYLYRHIARRT